MKSLKKKSTIILFLLLVSILGYSQYESKSVKISGITKYDLLVTTIEVPFDYYPTDEQTRKFIQ